MLVGPLLYAASFHAGGRGGGGPDEARKHFTYSSTLLDI